MFLKNRDDIQHMATFQHINEKWLPNIVSSSREEILGMQCCQIECEEACLGCGADALMLEFEHGITVIMLFG